MWWRVAVKALLAFCFGAVVAFSACTALSTTSSSSPDTESTVPAPSVGIPDSISNPSGPGTTAVTTAKTGRASKPPRGNPISVAITRNGKTFLPAKAFAKGPVGLKRDSRGNLVYRLGRTVLEAPPTSVAWYHEQGAWPKPGYPGPSVVVGHISYRGKPGPFYTLARIKGEQTGVLKGDVITVAYSSGDKVSFIVTDVDHPEKLDLPGAKIWNNTQRPVLRLVTCDPTTPFVDGHYTGNVVVYADQLVQS